MEHVSRWLADQDGELRGLAGRLQQPAQLGDLNLEAVGRTLRGFIPPDQFDQSGARHHPVRVEQEDSQQSPRFESAECDRSSPIPDLKWAEYAEFHLPPPEWAHCVLAGQ